MSRSYDNGYFCRSVVVAIIVTELQGEVWNVQRLWKFQRIELLFLDDSGFLSESVSLSLTVFPLAVSQHLSKALPSPASYCRVIVFWHIPLSLFLSRLSSSWKMWLFWASLISSPVSPNLTALFLPLWRSFLTCFPTLHRFSSFIPSEPSLSSCRLATRDHMTSHRAARPSPD